MSELGSEEIRAVRPRWAELYERLRGATPPTYRLTRFVILRLLGFVYVAAFGSLLAQLLPLIGHDGLLPADRYLHQLDMALGSAAVVRVPTIFWIDASDSFLLAIGWFGLLLAIALMLGFANAITLFVLWLLYMSFVHIGQLWYGYGWEIQLLETGFLAIFLCPLFDPRPFPARAPPLAVFVLFRWLIVRIMLGAGLIKMRGDECWRDLTCLVYHYETQPIPNPLSPALHFMPVWAHKIGTAFNHLVELVAPWFAFGPRVAMRIAGLLFVCFQVVLIISGNLSFLNWMTIVPALACFDDALLERVLPRALVAYAERSRERAEGLAPSIPQRIAVAGLVFVVAVLSIEPTLNLLSGRQLMNASFDPLELVNTYGAFGSVGRERNEIIFEGTSDLTIDQNTTWKAYEFPCKPGDPERRPCMVASFHHRLDWQIWFAAMSDVEGEPWTVHLVWKLLHGDRRVISLLANDPFPDRPPHAIRALLYHYEFAPLGDRAWWKRELIGEWLPPVTTDDPRLRAFLENHGWLESE